MTVYNPKHIDAMLKYGVFVGGGKGSGKTNLGMILAETLMKHGAAVKVFDISRAWLKSSIPNFVVVENTKPPDVPLYQSVVYEMAVLALLKPDKLVEAITNIVQADLLRQLGRQEQWIIFIFEECQCLVPPGSLRGKSLEAMMMKGLMTVGRNFKMGYVAMTQRPATVDATAIELCYTKFFGRMDGDNDKKKVSTWIGNKVQELEDFQVGQFYVDRGSRTQKIQTHRFEAEHPPTQLLPKIETPQPIQPQQTDEPKQASSATAFTVILFIVGLLMLLWTLWDMATW